MTQIITSIKKSYGKLLLKILGWKIVGELPKDEKYVAVIAPHTSIMDMFIGKIYNWAVGMKPSIMVKKEFFFFPVGLIIRSWGGIPVDRQNAASIVDQMAEKFKKRKKLILAITPEGTRALNTEWKTGFYRIAEKAQVPIYMVFGDFKKKTVGILGKFETTGNMEEDIKAIKRHFVGITGYHEHKFSVGDVS
jgi:1-acyl-sn-glycerol-3-phosphate acyltransferase